MSTEKTIFERIRQKAPTIALIGAVGGTALGLTGCSVEASQANISPDAQMVAAFEAMADETANPGNIVGVITIDSREEAGQLASQATALAESTDVYQANPEANDRTILISSIEHSRDQIDIGDSFALATVINPVNGETRLAVQNAPSGYTESTFPIETVTELPTVVTK